MALKRIIKRAINFVVEYRLRKKAIIGQHFLCGRTSRIASNKREQVTIESNVMMLGRLILGDDGYIQVGKNTSIRTNCIVYSAKRVVIGSNVIFSDNVIVSDTNHHPVNPFDRREMVESGWGSALWSWRHAISKEVQIGDNVWIGQYARITKGVCIGENSIVASNSVVTKDVPPNCIVAGNPARVVKSDIHKGSRVFPASLL